MMDRCVSTSNFPMGRGYGAPGACAAEEVAATKAINGNQDNECEHRLRVMITSCEGGCAEEPAAVSPLVALDEAHTPDRQPLSLRSTVL
jgi:hypothetical protein